VKKPTRKKVSSPRVIADLRAGHTPGDVAREHGLSPNRLREIQAEAVGGIPAKRAARPKRRPII
jgi:hypothetical protein